jgi:threonine aldolase
MVEKNLDLRSDTVTWPTPEMREAAAKAKVGDDVFGEDPTVNEIESLAAKILGKEAGLFVTSGTMGNLVGVLSHTQRGDEIILESRSHIFVNEVGNIATVGGLMARTVSSELGWMKPEDIEKAIRAENIHYPVTRLICVENTHNSAGGIAINTKQMKADWDVAKAHDLGVHLDGARLFNAAVALEVKPKDIAKYADTVQICLSKGLSAPVGSVVVGTEELITKARKYRKMIGGGMRQAGIIAAPGIIALTKMVDRLKDDHENAKLLADGLKKMGVTILNQVQTNMVYIDFASIGWKAENWNSAMKALGWKSETHGTSLRLCTHYGIEREDIQILLNGLEKLV